jgi:YD repeat-containing protein
LIGTVGADGKVRDKNGRIIGTVGPDGVVRDATTGNILGHGGNIVPGTPVYDKEGHLIGTVGADGLVRDANGNVIGKVGPDGLVRDANGNVIGRTGPTLTGTPVYDSQGRLIGVVGPDGKVRDASGKVIGTVGPDGIVRDLNGNVIGTTAAPGTTPPAAAGATTAGLAGLPAGLGGSTLGGPQAVSALPGANQAAQQLQAIAQRQAQMYSQQQADQLRTQMQGSMAGQAGQLIAAWVSPSQQYIEGKAPKNLPGTVVGGGTVVGTGTGDNIQSAPVVKAGTVMFGVLTTAINSDEPGPILGKIIVGKFKGGTVIGTMTNEGQKVLLTFNTLNMPNVPTSISINAVAIDPCTARTAFASCTNNHYLMRYGSLFASAFLQGYGQAFLTSGQTVVSTGLATATTTPDLSPAAKVWAALGNVGTRYSAVLGNVFNTPPTVRVYSGTAMGLLFLSDVPPLPTATNT